MFLLSVVLIQLYLTKNLIATVAVISFRCPPLCSCTNRQCAPPTPRFCQSFNEVQSFRINNLNQTSSNTYCNQVLEHHFVELSFSVKLYVVHFGRKNFPARVMTAWPPSHMYRANNLVRYEQHSAEFCLKCCVRRLSVVCQNERFISIL